MSQLEYLVALISIIVGLGLADLVRSIRELVQPSRDVRWHWLPLLWAFMVFLVILQLWWSSFDALRAEPFGRALIFLPYLSMFLVLYLVCSFALPDPGWESASSAPGETQLNLKAFYFSPLHRRWFFGAMIVLTILSQVISVALNVTLYSASWSWVNQAPTLGINLGVAILLYGLIASKRWWLHAVISLSIFGAILYTLAAELPSVG